MSGLPISPFSRHDEWRRAGSDGPSQGSQTSLSTCNTVHRLPALERLPSHGSRGSVASSRLRVCNENVPFERSASQLSLISAPSPSSTPSTYRSYKQGSYKSGHEDGLSTSPRKPSNLGILPDTGPLEDVEPDADNDHNSLHSCQSREQDHAYIPGVGYQSITKEEKSALCSTMSENTNIETLPRRTFTVASEHPFKADHSIQRWMSRLFRDGPNRIKSLKVREDRWTLDDSRVDKTSKPDLAPHRKAYGQRKASSWSSFHAARAVTASPGLLYSDEDGDRSRVTSRSRRSRFRRSKRSSRQSNGTGKASMDREGIETREFERSAFNRAAKRRKILEELVSSEESHIADLKVLLHVSQCGSSGKNYQAVNVVLSGLPYHPRFGIQGCSSFTARDFAQCRGHAAYT